MRDALNIASVMLTTLQGASTGIGDASHNEALSLLVTHDAHFAVNLPMPLNSNVHNMYAGHRSHSSHASHSSHYSGSGGTYATPATPATPPASDASNLDNSSQPPASSTAPSSPPQSSPHAQQKPSADQLTMMIMRVQAALYSKGYNPGAIDGQLSEATKGALRKFQGARGLTATGTMTTETLSALGIALP